MSNICLIKTIAKEYVLCTLEDKGDFYLINLPLEIVEHQLSPATAKDLPNIQLMPRPYLLAALDTQCEISKQHIMYIVSPNEESIKIYNDYLQYMEQNQQKFV